jgi:nucleotide-binding universal stress UspA family protein
MHKILVPVDFSEYAESALKAAADVAKKKNSELYILHVIEVAEPIMGTGSVVVDDEKILFFSQLAKKKLSEFLAKDYLKGIKLTNIIEVGPTYHSITRNIDKFDIDLIVMGSKGTSGIQGFFIGSNTEKVVRHSSVPVLVIKNKQMDLTFRKIVFVSDYDEENLSAFKKAQNFSRDFGTELKLMYVNTYGDDPDEISRINNKIKNFVEKASASFNPEDVVIYEDDDVDDGILRGAKSIQADCIVMATHGRRGLSHLFNGSIAEDVVNQSKIPVLTFKIEN